MDLLNPICMHCNGAGNDGAGRCPICKGHGRLEMSEDATVEDWVRWIREQPDVAHGVEVMQRLTLLHTAPAGLEKNKDDE